MQVLEAKERVRLDLGKRTAWLLVDGHRTTKFDVQRIDVLSRSEAERICSDSLRTPDPVLIVFERSSPEGREILHARGVSYVAPDGEIFIYAPPVYVERSPRVRVKVPTSEPSAPFATRSSRLARWLLLNPNENSTFRELARKTDLSEAMASRTMRALADEGLVAIERDPSDRRRRSVVVRAPGQLLNAYEKAVAGRRPRRVTWDVGTRDVASALSVVREAASNLKRPYAIGGLAGASLVRRVVEPSDVTLWIPREDIELWARELIATPARTGMGRVTAQLTPDPFVLSLATNRDDILVADPVQLFLDCRSAGERALEAADAIAQEMNW